LSAERATVAEREKALAAGLKAKPSDGTLNFFMGGLLRGVGMNERAKPYLAQGVTGDPLSGAKRLVYAQALAMMGQGADAEVQFSRPFRLPPPSAAIWRAQIRAAVLDGVGDVERLFAAAPADVSSEISQCWRDVATSLKAKTSSARKPVGARARACAE